MIQKIRTQSDLFPLISLLIVTVLWVISLLTMNPDNMADFGLISLLPVTFYIAFAILIISFAITLHSSRGESPWMIIYVFALIFFLHGIPPLVYGTLRYSWAWKHLGIIDYIERTGQVDVTIRYLNAYHNWPGFFTLNLFLTEVAGLENSLKYAIWAPVFFNTMDIGALLLIYKSTMRDKRRVWLSIWFFYLANWVGQDYFAPQAMGYLLHLCIIGVALRTFSYSDTLPKDTLKRWLRWNPLSNVTKFILDSRLRNLPSSPILEATQKVKYLALIILMFIVVASSHQLTPFMTVSAMFMLVASRSIKTRSLPLLLLILAMVWIAYFASAFAKDVIESTIEAFGQLSDNVDQNLVNLADTSDDQRITAKVGRLFSGGFWVLAFIGGIFRLYRRNWDVSLICLAIAPFLMMLANNYGGEILFRVFFFSIPFMSPFVAAAFFPDDASRTNYLRTGIIMILSGLFFVGFLFAHYGKDRQYYFSRNEVAASEFLYSTAPDGSLLIEGARNYPSQFKNYERFTYVPIDREDAAAKERIINFPDLVFERWMDSTRYTESYIVITRSQKAMIDMLGTMPSGSLENIEETLLNSPRFKVVYENKDVRIFMLND